VPALANALVPFLVFVTTLPRVAVAPLPLLWLGYGIARILKHLRLVAARKLTAVARGSSRATPPS
jgi:ABC-type nitrate/sulfonate/bicarbonate transport system permease component